MTREEHAPRILPLDKIEEMEANNKPWYFAGGPDAYFDSIKRFRQQQIAEGKLKLPEEEPAVAWHRVTEKLIAGNGELPAEDQ